MNSSVFFSASDIMNGMMNDSSSSTAMKNGMPNSKQGWSNHCATTSKMSGESLFQLMKLAGLCGADLSPSTYIPSLPSTSPRRLRIDSDGDAFLSLINGIFEPNIINAASQEDLFEPVPLTPQSGHQRHIVRCSSLENCVNLALEASQEDLFEPVPLTPQSGHQRHIVRRSSLENCLNLALEEIDTETDDYLFDDALEQIDAETDDSLFDDFAAPCNNNNKRCADAWIQTQESDQKRRRTTAPFINNVSGSDDTSPRFRLYQQNQWDVQFQELLAFKKEQGHCCVPNKFLESPILSRWVSAPF
jgi:hypothetical protein